MNTRSTANIQRLMVRAVTDFIALETGRLVRRHQGNLTQAGLFLAFCQASRTAPPRPTSVRAVGQSLRIPYETARRLTLDLAERGMVQRHGNAGYLATSEVLRAEDTSQAAADSYADLQTMMLAMEALGVDLDQFERDPAASPHPPPPAVRLSAGQGAEVKALIDAFDLRMMENSAKYWGSVFEGCMFCVVAQQTAGSLNQDPVLAWTYAGVDEAPPVTAWDVATVSKTAAQMGVPNQTISRHFNRLVGLGLFRRAPGGYQITREYMNSPAVLEAGGNLIFFTVQLVRRLRTMGVGGLTSPA